LNLSAPAAAYGNGNGQPHSESSNGNGSDVGRLTAKQLSAIFSLAKA